MRQLAEEGAITVQDVAEACGASRDCGSCATTIRELLTEGESRVVVAV
ncbi:MAG: (2Fe-2S)-binding protein [Actinomycetota bacterium]